MNQIESWSMVVRGVDCTAPGRVLRTRLFSVLDARIPNITVITAPTGFGKTTLLRGWALQLPADAPVQWINLAEEPVSLTSFWETVAVDDAETTIIIDGYENVGRLGPVVDRSILERAAANSLTKFIISTCSSTTLTEPRHRMHGRVAVLHHTDLAFTIDDIRLLVATHLPTAPASVAGSIYRETAGFPLAVSGMVLALASLEKIPADHSTQWRSLVAEDLTHQFSNPGMLKFVQVTSVAPYFDSALAKKLSKIGDVAAFIDELELKGFGRWNPYATNRPVFAYVESIRTIFATEFKQAHPKQFLRANSVTAKWFRGNSDYEDALTFAVHGKNYELATEIITTLFITSPESYMSDQLANLLRTIPLKALRNNPILAFSLGLAYSNNPLMAESANALLEAASDSLLKPSLGENSRNRFMVHTMRAVALRQIGRYQEAAEVAQTALFNAGLMSAEERDSLHGYLVLALRHLGFCLFQAGLVEESVPVINAAVAAAAAQPSINYSLSFAAGIHAFMGSNAATQQALEMTDPTGWPLDHDASYLNVLGTAGKAMWLIDQSDYEAAEQLLARSEHFCARTEFWPFTTAAMMQARLALGHGRREAQRLDALLSPAERSLGAQNSGIGKNLGTAAMHNMLAILWLSAGQPRKAAAVLNEYPHGHHHVAPARMLLHLLTGNATAAVSEYSVAVAAQGNTPRTRAALHILGAVASLRLESPANALKLLRKAFIVFQATGVNTHLMLIPAEDRAPLLELAESSGDWEIVQMLSAKIPATLSNMHLPAELSPREKVVLAQLVHHSSIDEIAGALFVSNNTVKTQLRSIYKKLRAGSRAEAIAKALELDLLN
ncbi:LuxR C-terminal-related transcriptional regulator [Arthrobacter alpinus]|uniref:LuxR C-terminal-related transcriptional regulator n=1 Tax=Arthrobacter alpinus TaxID=656366 RepID=UPI0009F97A38|nr:LuxR C-terminal-related transcriptional regulator [Arthrobacter alpinus]